jgi:hypothetical protein
MRHRAPTPLVRLLKAAPARRGIAAGAVLLLGASSGVYLAVSDDEPGREGRVVADPPAGEREGTSYPGAAALEDMSAARTPSPSRALTRGQARTRPSDLISARPTVPSPTPPDPSTPAAQPGPSTSRSASPGEPGGAANPPSPSTDPSSPPSSPPSPEPEPTSPPSTPPPAPTGPDTTAVTQVSAGGTWTVALASDGTLTSFQCSLDGAAYSPCGPVATFAGLGNGRHTLSARAVDGDGAVDPSPAVVTTQVTGLL